MPALALRPIGKDDYAVIDDGNAVGRIRHAAERTNDVWMWNVTVPIPGPPYGLAGDLDEAKVAIRDAWTKFKTEAGPDALAPAFQTQDNARSKGRGKRPLN